MEAVSASPVGRRPFEIPRTSNASSATQGLWRRADNFDTLLPFVIMDVMMVHPAICGGQSLLDIRIPCVRSFYGGISLSAVLLVSILLALPIYYPPWLRILKTPFEPFLTTEEAEEIIHQSEHTHEPLRVSRSRIRHTIPRQRLLITVSALEALSNLVGSYTFLLLLITSRISPVQVYASFVNTLSWFYIGLKAYFRPSITPSYDIFSLLITHFTFDFLSLATTLYTSYPNDEGRMLVQTWAAGVQCVIIALLLVDILKMPIGVESPHALQEKLDGVLVSEEDYTTLWGWISFRWVNDLLYRGTKGDLEEKEVPSLSPSFRSKPVYERFMEYKQSTLLRRILSANSLDMFLDFALSLISVICTYASPFFLKLILQDIEIHSNPLERPSAYVYAILMFVATLGKAEADVQHLWFGRRAATRMRSELMAAIYVKALRRKDFSGITNKEDKADDAKGKASAEKNDEANKAGGGTGKIVNLMSSDANRISNMVSAAYFLYTSPMELVVASLMLYRLLGWSAFAGFSVLVIATPVNHLFSKRGVTINRNLSSARDKRMSILNELMAGVKFIKFFAWETQWIKRVQEARQVELGWLISSCINSTMFGILWMMVPTFVSVISFWVYVYLGNELSISTAFTAIALFNMLKQPLGVLPMFIVMLLQAGVSLDRISDFLKEDEVPDYVSTFKRSVITTSASVDDEEIGILGASFTWNQIKEKEKATTPKKGAPSTPPSDEPAEEAESRFELRDINVLFPVGKLSLVVGPTASGKSALLLALLGEMTMLDGATVEPTSVIRLPKNPRQLDRKSNLYNAISYCAQTPWLEHATIKQNILFNSPLEEDRYQDVLRACELLPDLAILEDGDETEIGARGVSLSGGQKARVALARAIYSRTKHVLLDDPLAAVDSQTARQLYENVLLGPLMEGRSCILVTHHIDLVLPGAHYIVRMLDGRIDTKGPVEKLQEQGILEGIKLQSEAQALEGGSRTPSDSAETIAEEVIDGGKSKTAHARDDTDATLVASKNSPRKLVKDEERAKGRVKRGIYMTYLKEAGWFTWIWVAFGIALYQLAGVGEKLWIRAWGNHYDTQPTSIIASSFLSAIGMDEFRLPAAHLNPFNIWQKSGLSFASMHTPMAEVFGLPSASQRPLFYVAVYAAIGVVQGLIPTINSIILYFGSYRASKRLFSRLLGAVIGSPMRFFDTTPTGRILNRFSKDIETLDSSLASSLRSTSSWIAAFAAALVTVIVFLPWFFVPACLISYAYWTMSYGYVVAGRSLRRLESTTRSPIFAAFGDTLDGLVTVRAFSMEQRFVDDTHHKVDVTTQMWYGFWMLNRWLLLRFDSLGAISTLVTTVFAIARLDAGLAGLTITSAMALTMSVYWTCRMVTQLEMDLNSVERVVEYLDLPQEPPAVIESNPVPAYWPSSSTNALVVVEDLSIRYSPELPPVLHDVSFSLRPRERIGLLGRTGSGKSTLAMSLLRFVDPSSGRILVDGVDISNIGLRDLRSRVTIIPQDAVLFSGTIRENLDPFKEHSDEDCLDVLQRVHLSSGSNPQSQRTSQATSILEGQEPETQSIATSETGTTRLDEQKHIVTLESKVSAGGANFSQGQRQLIAMARALLRRSNIIIMDEATSSIDFETDALVQRMIREEFANSLMITIAHRIRTIIDYDRLIVLDQGRVVELDTPYNLIQRDGGLFRGMCLKSGHFDELLAACTPASGSS